MQLTCIALSVFATHLSLEDLENIFMSNSYSRADVILSKNNFYYHSFDTESDVWQFLWGEDNYNNSEHASAWFNMFVNNHGKGDVTKLVLQLSLIEDYSYLISQLHERGYVLVYAITTSRHNGDNEESTPIMSSYYSNKSSSLCITTQREKDYSIWFIEFYKRGGEYDAFNGHVIENEEGVYKASCDLDNGMLIGDFLKETIIDSLQIKRNNDIWIIKGKYWDIGRRNYIYYNVSTPYKPIHLYKDSEMEGNGTIQEKGHEEKYTGKVKIQYKGANVYNGIISNSVHVVPIK